MAVVTLEDVVIQLKTNKKSTDDVSRSLKEFLLMKKQEILDNLEAEREAKSQAKKDKNAAKQSETSAKSKKGGLNIFGMPGKGFLGNILKTFVQITAGLAAVSAGILGWRIGWTKAVTGTLKTIRSLPVISKGVGLVMGALYKIFGLKANMKGGNFSFRGIQGIKSSKLGFFGLLFFKIQGLLKIFTKSIMGGKALGGGGKVLGAFTGILRMVFGGIGKLARGVGTAIKPFMGFLRFGGRLFMGIFKKILFPIGILISAFDGVMAFMRSSESNLFLRIGDGFAGFMASFIGMPLNLLKDITAWVLEKMGFEGLAQKLGDLDFVKLVHKIYKAPFNIIASAWNFMNKFFKDPVGTIKEMWSGLLRKLGASPDSKNPYLDIFFNLIDNIGEWWLKRMGITEEQMKGVKFSDEVVKGWNKITFWIKSVFPSIIKNLKDDWNDASIGIRASFLDLGEFFKSLPKRITTMAKFYATPARFRDEKQYRLDMNEVTALSDEGQAKLKVLRRELFNERLQNLEEYLSTVTGQDYKGPIAGTSGKYGGESPTYITMNTTNLGTDGDLITQNVGAFAKAFNRNRSAMMPPNLYASPDGITPPRLD